MGFFESGTFFASLLFDYLVCKSAPEKRRMIMDPIRVVIADDHPLFREGLKRSFSFEQDVVVVGEA